MLLKNWTWHGLRLSEADEIPRCEIRLGIFDSHYFQGKWSKIGKEISVPPHTICITVTVCVLVNPAFIRKHIQNIVQYTYPPIIPLKTLKEIDPARFIGMCTVSFLWQKTTFFQEIRTICEDYTKHGMPVHPAGEVFIFWEPYFALSRSLAVALAVISCAVFVTISILLVNPWTGLSFMSSLVVIYVLITYCSPKMAILLPLQHDRFLAKYNELGAIRGFCNAFVCDSFCTAK
jgi:hypothetical protein